MSTTRHIQRIAFAGLMLLALAVVALSAPAAFARPTMAQVQAVHSGPALTTNLSGTTAANPPLVAGGGAVNGGLTAAAVTRPTGPVASGRGGLAARTTRVPSASGGFGVGVLVAAIVAGGIAATAIAWSRPKAAGTASVTSLSEAPSAAPDTQRSESSERKAA